MAKPKKKPQTPKKGAKKSNKFGANQAAPFQKGGGKGSY